jgi:hypothetical protein
MCTLTMCCGIIAAAFLVFSKRTLPQPHLKRRHWHLPTDLDSAGNNSRSKGRLRSEKRKNYDEGPQPGQDPPSSSFGHVLGHLISIA